MLEGGDQGPFARRERNEEVALCRRSLDVDRACHPERNARKSDEPFDAAGEQRRLDLRACAGDLLDAVAFLFQTLMSDEHGLPGGVGRRGQAARRGGRRRPGFCRRGSKGATPLAAGGTLSEERW